MKQFVHTPIMIMKSCDTALALALNIYYDLVRHDSAKKKKVLKVGKKETVSRPFHYDNAKKGKVYEALLTSLEETFSCYFFQFSTFPFNNENQFFKI